MRSALLAAVLSVTLGSAACFPVPVTVPAPRHNFEEEHHDLNIVIYYTNPGRGGDCWQHGDHWHCRR
ncbi:MAG TPA: hypothetical protein VKF60_14925 [Myxococcota bacterium]|nr:hypothetical protein [Myxococcota bacterium]